MLDQWLPSGRLRLEDGQTSCAILDLLSLYFFFFSMAWTSSSIRDCYSADTNGLNGPGFGNDRDFGNPVCRRGVVCLHLAVRSRSLVRDPPPSMAPAPYRDRYPSCDIYTQHSDFTLVSLPKRTWKPTSGQEGELQPHTPLVHCNMFTAILATCHQIHRPTMDSK